MAELDSLFAELRKEYEPDADARSRVRQRIGAAVAVGGALVTGSASASAAGVGASAGAAAGASKALAGAGAAKVLASSVSTWTVGAKLSAWIGVGLFASITGGVVFHELGAPATTTVSVSAPSGAAEVARARGRGLAAPTTLPKLVLEAHALDVEAVPSTAVDLANESAPVTANSDGAVSAKPASSSAVLEDLRLLQRASRALRAGDAAEARTLLAEHQRRFPRSVVKQERTGLVLLTRCSPDAGEGVRMEAERFLKAQPNSPLAEAVRKQCLP